MKGFTWPAGVRCGVFVSINFDAEVYDLKSTSEDRLFGRFSYGRYGVRAGLPRLLAMLQRQSIRATVFVTAGDALRHPDAVRALHDAGHEIGARGADLTPLPTLQGMQRDALMRGRDALAEITGVAPLGFRAAAGEIAPDSLRLLGELGFTYDSSFQDDDHPYVFAPTPSSRLAEVPTVSALDDSLPFSARHTHARVFKTWREEFEALHRESCLVPLTLHLRGDMGSTRAARIAALEALLTDIASSPGVRFMTGSELANLVLTSGTGAEADPDPYSAHQPVLSVTPYRGDLAVKPI